MCALHLYACDIIGESGLFYACKYTDRMRFLSYIVHALYYVYLYFYITSISILHSFIYLYQMCITKTMFIENNNNNKKREEEWMLNEAFDINTVAYWHENNKII